VSLKPGGSAGAEATLGSHQVQGKMLPELLEAWPSDVWREVGEATGGIE